MSDSVKTLVILAAGMGSRIRESGQDKPKPLVQVGGLPLLKRTILTARKAGVEHFVVILGYDCTTNVATYDRVGAGHLLVLHLDVVHMAC